MTHTRKPTEINAWHVQLRELSKNEHTHVLTMQPVTSWTTGTSKVTSTCSGQNPKVTFYYFLLLMSYTPKPSANPVSYTFKIYSELSLFSPSPLLLPCSQPPSPPNWPPAVTPCLFSLISLLLSAMEGCF